MVSVFWKKKFMICIVSIFLTSPGWFRVTFSEGNHNVYLYDSLPIQFVVGGWILTEKCGKNGSTAHFKVREVLHNVNCVPV